jgi:hypothetical protein
MSGLPSEQDVPVYTHMLQIMLYSDSSGRITYKENSDTSENVNSLLHITSLERSLLAARLTSNVLIQLTMWQIYLPHPHALTFSSSQGESQGFLYGLYLRVLKLI